MRVTRKLQKVNVRGDRAFHYFEKEDGTLLRVPCSLEEYRALGEKGAGQPKHPNGLRWVYSAIKPEYDTEDGDLPDDSYAVLPNSNGERIAVKVKEWSREVVTSANEVGADGSAEVDIPDVAEPHPIVKK